MIQLVNANSLHIPLADQSVHCVVTSPPYYGLRDYGTGKWEGGSSDCDHRPGNEVRVGKTTLQGGTASAGHKQEGFRDHCPKCGAVRIDNQIGLEETPEQYIQAMVAVFREVWRVLRDDGVIWVNVGDSYATQPGKGNNVPQTKWRSNNYPEQAAHRSKAFEGIKTKDLIGIPWMLAFALRADGWYLRSDNIWHKPNPMPESVTDRPTKAHEYLFLLSKRERYFYDNEAVKEAAAYPEGPHAPDKIKSPYGQGFTRNSAYSFKRKVNEDPPPGQANQHREDREDVQYSGTRNRRTVWEELEDEFFQFLNWKAQQPGGLPDVFKIATEPTPFAHFATYPRALVEPCIKAGTSERGVCPVCGKPWERVTERTPMVLARSERTHEKGRTRSSGTMLEPPISITTGWQPTCQHDAAPVPAVVLDPFAGSGTTGMVARSLGRNFIGLDLSLSYLRDIARERLGIIDLVEWTEGIKTEPSLFQDLPLFLEAS
jgi:DNA modification methylase